MAFNNLMKYEELNTDYVLSTTAERKINPEQNEELIDVLTRWSRAWEEHVLLYGRVLSTNQLEDAKSIGVSDTGKVKILTVPTIPMPPFPLVYETLILPGLLEPLSKAFTVGYGIFVRPFYQNMRWIITHELVHVMQHERCGGTREAIKIYLNELFSVGYASAPMELEAHSLSAKCMENHPE